MIQTAKFASLVLALAATQPAVATVVLTGDSITVSYAPHVAGADMVAAGGLNAESYVGALTSSTTNYAQDVVDLSPDTIVFMLGANDSVHNDVTAYRFNLFKNHIQNAFELFEQSTASRVLVLSILPVDEADIQKEYGGDSGDGMQTRVDDDYNPWLAAQAAARSKFEYVDVSSTMQQNMAWRNDWLHADGLHLADDAGQLWLADQVTSITAVPEPSPVLALLVCVLTGQGGRRYFRVFTWSCAEAY